MTNRFWAEARVFDIRHSEFLRHSSLTLVECRNRRGDKDVNQRDFEKEDPTESHELVITKTGQRPADPHEKENQGGDFCEEDCDVDQAEDPSVRAIGDAWEMPATEK
jgi:hypothetical protein